MDAEILFFGRYKVTATLGQGEMGTVYLAEDPLIGRQVAIKTLRRQPTDAKPPDDESRRRFEREMRATGMLVHPNIVPVLDVGTQEKQTFIAMAYVNGGSLGSLLANERTLPFHRIIELTSQIASGLDYAHERGIVHRDVKPDNILLTSEGTPLLSDFGVARLVDSTLTHQGTTYGSPAYMSPEQAAAQEVTGASDQFSLAIIIYRMLTDEVPFAGESITTVIYRILKHDPVPPELINPLVPRAAGEVVVRALSKLPSDRYPSCTALTEALAETLRVPVGSAHVSGSDPQPASMEVTARWSPSEASNDKENLNLPPLWASLTSRLATASRWLHSREGFELLSGWALLASRFTSANRRPLLIAASFVVVLATGMWLGAQLSSRDSTAETAPPERVNESAVAMVAPGILGTLPAASEPTDTESEVAAPIRQAGSEAPAPVTQETDTEPAGATGQETVAAMPQAGDVAPDPVPEVPEPVPATPEPVAAAPEHLQATPELVQATPEPLQATPEPVPAAPEPVPATPESVPAASEPVQAAPEPVPPAPDPEPTGAEDPEAVDTPDAEVSPSETNAPESRWTFGAEGTVPDKLVERALEATTVLDEIMSAPDQGIPASLLARAGCVAVIPNVKKVGFIFGATYGRGLVSCRTEGGWSRPSFVSMTGGSFGFQIGAQSTDFVLVFVNREAADRLLGNQFTLGGDASVSAGPVGRTVEAGTDASLRTEIYAYSRSRGLFAGVSLEGARLGADLEANEDAYGEPLGPEELLLNEGGKLPPELATFVQALVAIAAG